MGYLTQQVCLNGHQTCSGLEGFEEFMEKFCSQCGAATVTACGACKTGIRGYYMGSMSIQPIAVPSFCHECGQPYPWTAARAKAATELADELDDLSDDERAKLKDSLIDIMKDGPQTSVAVTRLKKFMRKVGKEGGSALYKIAMEVATEGAKKMILGT